MRRRRSKAPLLIAALVLVAGAIGVRALISERDERADGDRQAELAGTPSTFGELYDATTAGTGLRWRAPRSQVTRDLVKRTSGTVFDGVPYERHLYGDYLSDDINAFQIRAFPAKVGAGDDEEQQAWTVFDGREQVGEPVAIEVAGHQGVATTGTARGSSTEVVDGRIVYDIRQVAVSIDGAFLLVTAMGTEPAGVDETELARLLATIEYDSSAEDQADLAGVAGEGPIEDDRLERVTDDEAALTWTSPTPTEMYDYSNIALDTPLQGRFRRYTYVDILTTYTIQVWPRSTGATDLDEPNVPAYFFGGGEIQATEPVPIAGQPGLLFEMIDDGDRPVRQLVAAAEVEGAFVMVEVTRNDRQLPTRAELERLLASFARA